jgi:RecJ-like exonuclease
MTEEPADFYSVEMDKNEEPCEKCGGTGSRLVAGEPTMETCGECSGEGVVPKTTFGGAKADLITVDDPAEWLSSCCSAPPHPSKPDVGESDPTGVCGQCKEHCTFERRPI